MTIGAKRRKPFQLILIAMPITKITLVLPVDILDSKLEGPILEITIGLVVGVFLNYIIRR